MAGNPPRLPLLALLASAALALGACGGEESNNRQLLPEKQAEPLLADIEAIESAAASGDCQEVDANIEELQERIGDLGLPISKKLKDNLREGADLLEDVAADCEDETSDEEPADTGTTDETEPVEPEVPEDTTDSGGVTPEVPAEEEPAEEEPDVTEPPAEEEPPAEQPEPVEPVDPTPDPVEPAPTDPGSGSGGIGPGAAAGGR